MATAKTGSFFLTESIQLAAAQASGVATQGVIDLGAYVNVPTGQAVAITAVDFIVQRDTPYGQNFNGMLAVNGAISMQLSDLNPGTTLIRADDQSLIASGGLNIDVVNNIGSETADFYPDNFGGSAALSDAFMVVNDSLYFVGMPSGSAVGADDLWLTVKITAKVVKLSSKNWMAIAIQSTASDN